MIEPIAELWNSGKWDGPWIGGYQDSNASEPEGGWNWVTGEPWIYTNWQTGQPDNNSPNEQYLRYWQRDLDTWNDQRDDSETHGYIIEWSADCNGDGIVDYGQILDGTLEDNNGNNIPDICETGACCLEGKCDTLDVDDCMLLGGIFFGDATTCDQLTCDGTWLVDQGGSGHFNTIQEAIAAADDGDFVLVMPGHYFENITFLGKAITVQSSMPINPELTTIDGGGTFDNTVVFAAGEDGDSVLNGFIITGGNSPLDGGGIYCTSSPTIRNCIISGNHADGNGGGIYITGNPTLDACIIRDNDADGLGNSLYISNSSPSVLDCMIGPSSSPTGEAVYIYGSGAQLTNTTVASTGDDVGVNMELSYTVWTNSAIRNCSSGLVVTSSLSDQFIDCAFSNNGAAMFTQLGIAGAPSLLGCSFTSNGSTHGGGLYCDAGTATIDNCAFTGNAFSDGGGGIYFASGSEVTVSNSAFDENGAALQATGGAIYCASSSVVIADCIFSSNTARSGGAVFCASGMSPVFTGCTFLQNTSSEAGFGGAFCSEFGNPVLEQCMFQGNVSSSGGNGAGGAVYVNGGSSVLSYCIFDGNSSHSGGALHATPLGHVSLDNCVFTNNSSPILGGGYTGLGGAILTREATSLNSCHFEGNTAARGGGGIATEQSADPVLVDCTFRSNTSADGEGGAFFNSGDSAAQFYSCLFEFNVANDGGAICNHLAGFNTVTLSTCTFDGNIATNFGGAIRNYRGVDAVSCNFQSNSALLGGGIANDGDVSLSDCGFTTNLASLDGGAVYSESEATVSGCTFSGNSCQGSGGAILLVGGVTVLNGCTLDQNSAVENGGGLCSQSDSQATFAECQFTRNLATNGGGAAILGAGFEVADSVFDENNATNGAGLYMAGGSLARVELKRNTAVEAGGGLFVAQGAAIPIADSLICGNIPDWIEGEWIDGTGNDFPVNCPTDCPGDYDSDGDVNVVDILGVIGDWGPCNPDSPCPSDFDGDGVVGVNDLLTVIANWGPCP